MYWDAEGAPIFGVFKGKPPHHHSAPSSDFAGSVALDRHSDTILVDLKWSGWGYLLSSWVLCPNKTLPGETNNTRRDRRHLSEILGSFSSDFEKEGKGKGATVRGLESIIALAAYFSLFATVRVLLSTMMFPSIVVLVGCLILMDGCGGEVTLQRAKDIRFNTMKETKIEKDKGRVFCFKNRVACVEYEYNADGDVLAFIVLKDSLTNTLDTAGISTVDFISNTNRTGPGSYERVDRKLDTDNYCVVFVNGPFESPFYAGVENGTTVEVRFEIQGCPTKYQKLVAILVPIGGVLLVAACFSAWWIRRRRNVLKDNKEKQNQHQHPHHGHHPSDPNVAYHPGQPPPPPAPPGHMNGAFPAPAHYNTPGAYQVNPRNGVPAMPGQMNVPMGTIPYGNAQCFPTNTTTGVPVLNAQGVRDPSGMNAVWAAAAERIEGADGRTGNEQGERNVNAGNVAVGVDSRDLNTVPYASGMVPRRGSENVADSDTRV